MPISVRLWSLHPKYLDVRGLTACWREGLLARKVLLGQTHGYTRHPQLERFRAGADAVGLIDAYLTAIHGEATERGYRFNGSKIGQNLSPSKLTVTAGQLRYEAEHLLNKLTRRDPSRLIKLDAANPDAHPLFHVIPGEVEEWERIG